MRRMTSTDKQFRTLGDEELSVVSGGHRHHHHHCHRRSHGELQPQDGAPGGAGGLDSLVQMILQGNMAAIFQFVIGNGNNVSAGVSQANLAP